MKIRADKIKLCVTIDVEEEGLFSGEYPREGNTENVSRLELLDEVFVGLQIRPTLLVDYPAASNPAHQKTLMTLKDRWNAEIGAHLHHWNTPPFRDLPYKEPIPSELMPTDLLEAKLLELLGSLRSMGVEPEAFRMGRFNIGPKMFSLLEKHGFTVDASIAPMRKYYGGPDHLNVPTDPYFPDPADLGRPGSSTILEVPMTILPLTRNLGKYLNVIARNFPSLDGLVKWSAMNLLSLPAQPMWTGLERLKAAVGLHMSRGGKVITTFFHSSELLPGGCPQHGTFEQVNAFIDKLRLFLEWLVKNRQMEPLTLSELSRLHRARHSR